MQCYTWCPAGIISVIGISFTFINVTIQSMSNMMVSQAVQRPAQSRSLWGLHAGIRLYLASWGLTQDMMPAESRRHLE